MKLFFQIDVRICAFYLKNFAYSTALGFYQNCDPLILDFSVFRHIILVRRHHSLKRHRCIQNQADQLLSSPFAQGRSCLLFFRDSISSRSFVNAVLRPPTASIRPTSTASLPKRTVPISRASSPVLNIN